MDSLESGEQQGGSEGKVVDELNEVMEESVADNSNSAPQDQTESSGIASEDDTELIKAIELLVVPLPTKDVFESSRQDTPLYELFEELVSVKPDYSNIKQEINSLIQTQQSFDGKTKQELSFFAYPEYAGQVYIAYLIVNGESQDVIDDVEEKIQNIERAVNPVADRLVLTHMAPRPNQISALLKEPFYPILATNSPAFPCKKIIVSVCILEALLKDKRFDNIHSHLTRISDSIADSQLQLGLITPTNLNLSYDVGTRIARSNQFVELFGL